MEIAMTSVPADPAPVAMATQATDVIVEKAPDTQQYRPNTEMQRIRVVDIFTERKESSKSGAGAGGHAADKIDTNGRESPIKTNVKTLTWWDGVLIPCLLNIWGVM